MPKRMRRRCGYQGCPRPTYERFCEEHRGFDERVRTERQGTAYQRGYDSQWAVVAQRRRELDFYLCRACLKDERLTESKTVDHIIPLHVRPDWRLEIDNTQVLCPRCHARKTADDTRRYGSSTQRVPAPRHRAAWDEALRLVEPPRRGEPEQ